MQAFNNLSIAVKLWLIVFLALAGMLLATALQLSEYRDTLVGDRKAATRHLVQTAHSTLAHYHAQVEAGELTEEQGQRAATAALKAMRYDQKDYFWINDMQPAMVMHPFKPELDGQDLSGFQDPAGKRLFAAFVERVRADGAGFVEYQWPKPGLDKPVPKISYVQGFAPWGWVVGTGIYVDDVDTLFWAELRYQAAIFAITALALVALTLLINRSVTIPIAALRRVMEKATREGDLNLRSDIRQKDEIGRMATDFDRFLAQLQDFVSGVVQASTELTVATRQMATLANQTRQAMDSQQGETDQVATAMHQMSATAQEVAANVSGSASAAQEADRETRAASRIFDSAVGSMRALVSEVENTSGIIGQLQGNANRIGTVLDVIRGIAEQTNLLALNAAIEAARAGEQGRGFAVVADEVRTLAQRTQESTEEIHAMIESLQSSSAQAVQAMEASRAKAEQSDSQASQAGESLQNITLAIGRINEMSSQIATAAEEQTNVAEEINRSLVTIASAAGQTAESSRQTAEAGARSQALTEELLRRAEVFKG